MLTDGSLDLAGKTVLIVEDEPVLALEIQSAVEEAGGIVVGPALNVEKATALIAQTARIDAAILDVRLHDGVSVGIAQELKRRGVEVIFVTGYDDWFIPDDVADLPIQRKPTDATAVVGLLFGHHLKT